MILREFHVAPQLLVKCAQAMVPYDMHSWPVYVECEPAPIPACLAYVSWPNVTCSSLVKASSLSKRSFVCFLGGGQSSDL